MYLGCGAIRMQLVSNGISRNIPEVMALDLCLKFLSFCDSRTILSVGPEDWRKALYIGGVKANQILAEAFPGTVGLYPKLKLFAAEVHRLSGYAGERVVDIGAARVVIGDKRFCPVGSMTLLVGASPDEDRFSVGKYRSVFKRL